MKTEILNIKGSWQEVVDDCRSTVGRDPLGRQPSEKFKRSILIAEHSPIRDLSVKWRWGEIKSWIATHWMRHKWECFVRTQRSDRTGVPRDELPQSAPVIFVGEANAQSLIDTMRKRLCFQAAPETRAYAENLKRAITKCEPELGDVLVPNCVYRGGCPEMSCCGFYHEFLNRNAAIGCGDIKKRYDAYNRQFQADWNSGIIGPRAMETAKEGRKD